MQTREIYGAAVHFLYKTDQGMPLKLLQTSHLWRDTGKFLGFSQPYSRKIQGSTGAILDFCFLTVD